MDTEQFEKEISAIPHLNLTKYLPPVPVESIIYEMNQNRQHISKFDYSRNVPPERMKYVQESWQGFSLVDITAKGAHMIDYYTTNMTHERVREMGVEMKDDGYARFQITDIGKVMPVTTAYTTGIFTDLCRIRVSKVAAGMVIPYHCHQAKARQNPDKIVPDNSYRATIHIPLIMNKDCWFSVTEDNGTFTGHPDDFKLGKGSAEYHQQYKPGEVWMFNSVHYHRAVNMGKEDRFHLLIYFDFLDTKIRKVIEQAIADYDGPRIT